MHNLNTFFRLGTKHQQLLVAETKTSANVGGRRRNLSNVWRLETKPQRRFGVIPQQLLGSTTNQSMCGDACSASQSSDGSLRIITIAQVQVDNAIVTTDIEHVINLQ